MPTLTILCLQSKHIVPEQRREKQAVAPVPVVIVVNRPHGRSDSRAHDVKMTSYKHRCDVMTFFSTKKCAYLRY